MRTVTLLFALVALSLPAHALATATCSNTDPRAIAINTPAGTYYIVSASCQSLIGDGSCVWSLWLYQETNGIPGLQHGDGICSDVCTEPCPPDTDVF